VKVWQQCRVLVRDAEDALQFEDDDVELKQDGDQLSVLYWDDDGALMFGGLLGTSGEYELVCRSRPRTATLAWSHDESRLEGTWRQGSEHGTWAIVLGEA
jgi:hypothetical protein